MGKCVVHVDEVRLNSLRLLDFFPAVSAAISTAGRSGANKAPSPGAAPRIFVLPPRHTPSHKLLHFASSSQCTAALSGVAYQHWRWKAAGQWSQQSRSPPSRQLSQVSWLVALPLLRTSLTSFRLRFSTSSDLGGASNVWICCKS